jgi:hypothetical protein
VGRSVLSFHVSKTVSIAQKNEIETESDEQMEQHFMSSSDNSFVKQLEAQSKPVNA